MWVVTFAETEARAQIAEESLMLWMITNDLQNSGVNSLLVLLALIGHYVFLKNLV